MESFKQFDRLNQKSGLLCGDDVRPFLIQAYGREPPELEVEKFVNAFNKHGALLPYCQGLQPKAKFVTLQQFIDLLPEVREELSKVDKSAATEYKSSNDIVLAKKRGTAAEFGPREKYRTPMTSSQDYGWHVQLPHETPDIKQKKTCPETQFASEMIRSGII